MDEQKWLSYLKENVDKKYASSLDAVNVALKSAGCATSDSFLSYGHSCPLVAGCIVVAKRKSESEFVGFFKEKNPQGDYVVISVNTKKTIGMVVLKATEVVAIRYPILPSVESE